jgi:hypothetical protein
MRKALIGGVVLCPFLFPFLGHTQTLPSTRPNSVQSCSEAAKKALGANAEVLKCGQLTGPNALQAVAIVRLKQYRSDADGIPVAKLVVLRKDGPEWRLEFAVDSQSMRNGAGYIEDLSSIAGTFVGFRAALWKHGSGPIDTGFTITLYFLSVSGEDEGTSVEISWNRSVGRFQEFSYDEDPSEFKPEIKNLGAH